MFLHPTPAGLWLDCPLENAASRWKFPLWKTLQNACIHRTLLGKKQEEESVYASKACLHSNLTSFFIPFFFFDFIVIPVVLAAIAYCCQLENSSGRPCTQHGQSSGTSTGMDRQKSAWKTASPAFSLKWLQGETLLQNTMQHQVNLNYFSQLQPFHHSGQILEAVSA